MLEKIMLRSNRVLVVECREEVLRSSGVLGRNGVLRSSGARGRNEVLRSNGVLGRIKVLGSSVVMGASGDAYLLGVK